MMKSRRDDEGRLKQFRWDVPDRKRSPGGRAYAAKRPNPDLWSNRGKQLIWIACGWSGGSVSSLLSRRAARPRLALAAATHHSALWRATRAKPPGLQRDINSGPPPIREEHRDLPAICRGNYFATGDAE